jgi:hypothetical protein
MEENMRKKGMAILAGTLVVLLAWANVGLAGQKDRLREKVRVLSERVTTLEVRMEDAAVVYADEVVFPYPSCSSGSPAIWEDIPDGPQPDLVPSQGRRLAC